MTHTTSLPNRRRSTATVWRNLSIRSIWLGFLVATMGTCFGLDFNITYHDSIPADVRSDVIRVIDEAAAAWEEILLDDVTITFQLKWVDSFQNPAEGGRASVYYMPSTYSDIRTALINKAKTEADRVAITHLEPGALRILLNRTSDNPNGAGSATPYLDADNDANNHSMRISLGNARVLGLFPAGLEFDDGRITMSGRPNWDYDRSDGITTGKADFYAIALHEIGHLLGMSSLIDSRLSVNPGQADDYYTFLTPLDLFRYSKESVSENAVDWTSDARGKFLSGDGGQTAVASFATGMFGDRGDPSHWGRDSDIDGIFEAAVYPMQTIEAADILALDLVGWEVAEASKELEITSARLTGSGLYLEWTTVPGFSGYRIMVSNSPDKNAKSAAPKVLAETKKNSFVAPFAKGTKALDTTRFYYVEAYN